MSSSSSSSYARNNGEIVCHCGKIAMVRTSWTRENPSRRFRGCPNFNGKGGHCNFFDWVDPELPNAFYKRSIYEINLEIKKLKQDDDWEALQKVRELENDLKMSKLENMKLIEELKSMEVQLIRNKAKFQVYNRIILVMISLVFIFCILIGFLYIKMLMESDVLALP